MMDSVWLVLAAAWIKNGHGGAGAWTAILVVTALVTGFGNMLVNTLWETTLQQHIPPASLSRVSAYDWFGSLLCEPAGLALAGVAAAGIGMSRTLWIAAADRREYPAGSRMPATGAPAPCTPPGWAARRIRWCGPRA
jgi:hypothetical protein